jgi:hypothetical protein
MARGEKQISSRTRTGQFKQGKFKDNDAHYKLRAFQWKPLPSGCGNRFCPTQLACVLPNTVGLCVAHLACVLPNNTQQHLQVAKQHSCQVAINSKGKTGGDDGKQRCQVESNSRRRRRVTEIGALPGNNAMEDCVFVSDGPIHARVQNLSGLS